MVLLTAVTTLQALAAAVTGGLGLPIALSVLILGWIQQGDAVGTSRRLLWWAVLAAGALGVLASVAVVAVLI